MKEYNVILDLLYLELKYYKNELIILENNKPIIFTKKRKMKYNLEKDKIMKKIDECNFKIQKEIELQINL